MVIPKEFTKDLVILYAQRKYKVAHTLVQNIDDQWKDHYHETDHSSK